MSNCCYWYQEFYFKTAAFDGQKIFPGLNNIDLVSMRQSDRRKCYCNKPAWWMQHDAPLLSLLVMPLILASHSALVLRGAPDEKNHVCNIALKKYDFMFGNTFRVHARDGAYLSYDTYSAWFDNLSCSVLYRVFNKNAGCTERFWHVYVCASDGY